ncbi:MAG: hypothetical protein A3F43_05415 [Gammaproteobacteria bacterium RIFCSPHIGHO2_12_FULL_42_10]|nr:MAG: hypothetical protein A3F43_05415 [Gammaproteobacteria bacterium RIFCSPHIGHO2_12_FULL_42_10]
MKTTQATSFFIDLVCTLCIYNILRAHTLPCDQSFTIKTNDEIVTDIMLDSELLAMISKMTPSDRLLTEACAQAFILSWLEKVNRTYVAMSYPIQRLYNDYESYIKYAIFY